MHFELRTGPFDPYGEAGDYARRIGRKGEMGAAAVFIGTMRDFNEGEQVDSMELEHYPGMTEKHLAAICDEALGRWRLLDCLVLHRVGHVHIGEAIVLVAAWSAHRGDAMDACRFLIEDLKSRAPFWKKEQLRDRDRWVEKNSTGYAESGYEADGEKR